MATKKKVTEIISDIDDNTIYEFTKMEELTIGSGMVLAYYLIK